MPNFVLCSLSVQQYEIFKKKLSLCQYERLNRFVGFSSWRRKPGREKESEETASNIQMYSWIKTREALLRAQQLLPLSCQRQGGGNRSVFESKFAV